MKLDRPIAIAVIVFIILAVIFYFVLPRYREIREFQIKIAEKEAELKGKEDYFRGIAEVYQKLVENEENIKKINTALPDKINYPALISFLQEKSQENGLVLRTVNLGGTSQARGKEKLNQTNFSLRVDGSYSAFRNFISSLENSSRIIELDNVSFSSRATRTEEEPNIYQFSLGIRVYSY